MESFKYSQTQVGRGNSYNTFQNELTLKCYNCKKELPFTEQYFGKRGRVGSNKKPHLRTTCKKCECELSRERLSRSFRHYVNHLLIGIRCEKKRCSKGFDLDTEYIMNLLETQNYKCALSGIDLTHFKTINRQERILTNLSIDRINSKLGYVKGNIQILAYIINIMKQKMTNLEFISICKRVDKWRQYEKVEE